MKEMAKVHAELAEYRKKAEEYLNPWKRTAADFENYKKRREKENRQLLKFAQEVTVVKILPTLESLEQALRHSPDDERYKEWSEGVVKIVQQLEKVLLEMGVEKIRTVGETGTILEEIQSGYKLNHKVIRPAKVKVVKRLSS